MDEMYKHLECVPSINQELVYMFFSTASYVDCYCCTQKEISSHSFDPLTLKWIQRFEGKLMGPLFRSCILIIHNAKWSIVFEGQVIASGLFNSSLEEPFLHENTLLSFPDYKQCIGIRISYDLGEIEEKFINLIAKHCSLKEVVAMYEMIFRSDSLQLSQLCEVIEDPILVNHVLCLLLDHYWVVCDFHSIEMLLSLIQPSILLDCYKQSVKPVCFLD